MLQPAQHLSGQRSGAAGTCVPHGSGALTTPSVLPEEWRQEHIAREGVATPVLMVGPLRAVLCLGYCVLAGGGATACSLVVRLLHVAWCCYCVRIDGVATECWLVVWLLRPGWWWGGLVVWLLRTGCMWSTSSTNLMWSIVYDSKQICSDREVSAIHLNVQQMIRETNLACSARQHV